MIHCDSSCAVEVKNSRLLRNKEYQNIPKSRPPFSRSRVLMQNLSPTHASKQFPTNEMLQMSAEMCRKPRRESISFSLGDDPTGNHGKSKMIKMINMITRSRDNTHVRRKCRRRFSCLVFATPALKSSPPRAPICAIWAPWSFQVLFWSSFDIFWTSFGHSVCPSYVILCRLTSSYVILRLFASNNGPVDLVCPLPSLYLSSQHFTDFTSVWF